MNQNTYLKQLRFIQLIIFLPVFILSSCFSPDINENIAMYIILREKEEDIFIEELIEETRYDSIDSEDFDKIVFESGLEVSEPDILDLLPPEPTEKEKEFFKFLKTSNAFYTIDKNLIDTTIKILTKERSDGELLCGYDMDLYISKKDTIIKYYTINTYCKFMFGDSLNGYYFDNIDFYEKLKMISKIDAELITFGYKKEYYGDSIPIDMKQTIRIRKD